LESSIARREGSLPTFDREVLRPVVECYAADLAKAFDQDGTAGNRALRALLGDRRIGVYADEERSFRLDGEFELTGLLSLNEHCAQPVSTERSGSVVAGARFERSTTPLRVRWAA
jgi:hypothetical protein